jgi:hypothetical protein
MCCNRNKKDERALQPAGRAFVTPDVQSMRSRVGGMVRRAGLQSIPPLQHWSVRAVEKTRVFVSLPSAYSRAAQHLPVYLLKAKTV